MRTGITKIASNTNMTSTTSTIDEKHKTEIVNKIYQQLGRSVRQKELFGNKPIRSTVENLVSRILESTKPSDQLLYFKTLRDFVPLDAQAIFSVVVTVNQEEETWDYHFVIDDLFVTNNEKPLDIISTDDIFLGFFETAYPQDNQLLGGMEKALAQLKKPCDLARLASLITTVNQESHPKTLDSNMAEKFVRIAEFYPDVHFVLEIEKEKSYTFSIEIAQEKTYEVCTVKFSPFIQDKDPLAFAKLWAVKIKMNTDFQLYLDRGELTIEKMVEGNIQCMADNAVDQQTIKAALHNPAYNNNNFVEIKKHPDSSKMIAVFKEVRELVFSNRGSQKFELRGSILKKYLEETAYNSLYDIVSAGFKTEQDAAFLFAAFSSKMDFWRTPLEKLPLEDQNQINQQLAVLTIGNTTFGKLWGIEPAELDSKPSPLLPPQAIDGRV